MLRFWFFASTLVLLSGCAGHNEAANLQPTDNLSGQYVHNHVISHLGAKDWEESTVRDSLSLRQRGDSLHVYLALIHTNYHICEMQTTAFRRGESFESKAEPIEFGGTSSDCILRITATRDSILLNDVDDQCRRTYCGMRGYIDGTVFPRR